MNSAKGGADTSALLNEINAALEIVAAEQNVIEHRWQLIDQRRHIGLLSLVVEHKMRSE